MSKTDKTNPWDVKLLQNPQMRREDHDHRKGYCDLGFERKHDKIWLNCSYRFNGQYHYTSGVYGRPGSYKVYVNKANRRERTRLRNAVSDMLKAPHNDFQNFHHRHSARWEAY